MQCRKWGRMEVKLVAMVLAILRVLVPRMVVRAGLSEMVVMRE